MFAQPISMPRFKSINFYLKTPKIKLQYFCKKMQNCLCAGGSFPRLPCLGKLGALPSKHPLLYNFGYAPGVFIAVMLFLCKLILRLADVYGFPQTAFF